MYNVNKKSEFNETKNLNVTKKYSMNYNNEIENGIKIKTITLEDEDLVNKVILKRINNKFIKILEKLYSNDDDDSDPYDGLMKVLDETEKFKQEVNAKYRELLKKKEMEIVNKKIKLLQTEIKNKLISYQIVKQNMDKLINESKQEQEEKETHRSR